MRTRPPFTVAGKIEKFNLTNNIVERYRKPWA